MSWMHTGNQEYKEEQKLREERNKGPYRFFMSKQEDERRVFFIEPILSKDIELEDEKKIKATPGCYEHQLLVDGDFRNWFTCSRGLPGFDGCYLCEQKYVDSSGKHINYPRSHINVATIIDCTPYTDREGNEVKFSKKLMVMKNDTYERLLKKNQTLMEQGHKYGLRGHIVSVGRIGDKSPAAGNDFEVLEKVKNPKEYFQLDDGTPIDLTPYNYEEIFEPKTEDFFKTLFEKHIVKPNQYVTGGGSETNSKGANVATSNAAEAASEEHPW